MERESGVRYTKSMIWGAFLILLGGAFLLEQLGMLSVPHVGRLWPLVFYVIAATHFVEHRPGSGLMMALMGTWFFAVTFHWMGLTYANSWPLILVAVGVSIVVQAITGEQSRRWSVGEGRRGPQD